MARWWQARGAAGVASVGGDQGLPHARHSQVQSAPMDPPQDTAEHISQADGTSAKTFKKYKMPDRERRREQGE